MFGFKLEREFVVPLIIGCALLMELMNATVIATALPVIADAFGEDPIRLNLAITAYLLSLGIFIPLSGWLADIYGARRVFVLAILVFTAGSISCAFAVDLWSLIAARMFQGIGGAMMVPVGRLIILRAVEKSRLVDAMAYLTVPALLGPMLGPPLGGFVATYFSWRWIFLINVPIGAIGVVLALKYLPQVSREARAPLDKFGFLCLGLGLGAAMFGFETAGRGVVPTWAALSLLFGGLVLLGVYAFHALRDEAPILDLRLMSVRTFRTSTLGGFAFRLGVGAMPFLVPMMLQLGFGMTPFESGLITFVGAVGALMMKIAAAPAIRFFGFRRVLLVNTLLGGASMAVIGFVRPDTYLVLLLLVLFVGGFFRSLQFTALNTLAYADIAPAEMSQATTFSSVGQQLALAMGVGFGAMLLHLTQSMNGDAGLSASDFMWAFLIVGGIMMASALCYVNLPSDAGDAVSGRFKPEPAPPPAD